LILTSENFNIMTLGKVVGDVVSTIKHQDCNGYKLLVVRPIDRAGNVNGKPMLAIDAVQAGIGDIVLVIDEGGSGRDVLGAPDRRTIRTVISGIVDEIGT
jgi:microcompartment protein CcmK/EutM